jgi:aconitate hydratase
MFLSSTITSLFVQGVKAVIAESFDEVHRCSLIGIGILPLQFIDGQNSSTLGLNGREIYTIELDDEMSLNQQVKVKVSDNQRCCLGNSV